QTLGTQRNAVAFPVPCRQCPRTSSDTPSLTGVGLPMAPHSRDAPPLLFLVRGRSADRRHSLSHQSLGARRHVSLYLRASIPPSPPPCLSLFACLNPAVSPSPIRIIKVGASTSVPDLAAATPSTS
ncbi:hypothetical protein LINPERPRIM_LOCUS35652, partial [Linum perenne]